LPIVETLEGQISAYIPTNVISITDGQICLQKGLFHSGIRPAIYVGISVSRVGGDAQAPAMKKVAGKLRLDLATYHELQTFARLGTELDSATRSQLERGTRMVELLKQPQLQPCPLSEQVVSIYAGCSGLLDDIPVASVRQFIGQLLEFLRQSYPQVLGHIDKDKTFPDELAQTVQKAIVQFKQQWRAQV
jgi:F-type H+-transporting ATPase subunit alpha